MEDNKDIQSVEESQEIESQDVVSLEGGVLGQAARYVVVHEKLVFRRKFFVAGGRPAVFLFL